MFQFDVILYILYIFSSCFRFSQNHFSQHLRRRTFLSRRRLFLVHIALLHRALTGCAIVLNTFICCYKQKVASINFILLVHFFVGKMYKNKLKIL